MARHVEKELLFAIGGEGRASMLGGGGLLAMGSTNFSDGGGESGGGVSGIGGEDVGGLGGCIGRGDGRGLGGGGGGSAGAVRQQPPPAYVLTFSCERIQGGKISRYNDFNCHGCYRPS